MPEGNPLVAKAPTDGDGPGPLTAGNSDYGYAAGIGVAESAMDAFNGISNGDWIGGGLGVLSLAGEIASAAIDPFGYLMSSVASFLMEHMQPLKDMLDAVAGDPPVIQSYSETWGNVAKKLEDTQVDLANKVKNGTSGWTGEAADQYRKQAAEQAEAISAAATVAGGISTVVMIFGEIVAFVREFIRQLIADAVGKLIAWVMETVFSLGFGTPIVVAQAVTAIAKWAAKIADKLKELCDAMRRVSPLLGKLADVFEKIIKIFGKIAGKVTGLDVINTRNIKPGGFVQRGGSGGGSGGSGGGTGSGDGPDGDGSGSGSGDGSGSGSGDGSNGSNGSDGDSGSSGDSGRSGDSGGDSPPNTTRAGDGGGSPSTRDGGGSSRSDGGSPNRAGDGDGPSTSDGNSGGTPDGGSPNAARSDNGSPSDSGTPNRTPDNGSPSRADTGGSPSSTPDAAPHTRTDSGGSPAPHTRTDTGGSPSNTPDAPNTRADSGGSPSNTPDGGSPAPHTRADSGGSPNNTPDAPNTRADTGGSPSHAPDAPNTRTDTGGSPSHTPDAPHTRADTGGSPSHTPDAPNTRPDTGGSPSHTGDGGGSPRTHGGDGGGAPTPRSDPSPGQHGGGNTGDGGSPTRPTDSGTTTSGTAPTAPRLGDAGPSHVPSQRGGTGGDGSPGVPPQGQPMAGGMPPQGAPGGTPGGTPGSPGGRPQGGGWTGTPGSPRTPDTHAPRTPDTHTGPGRGPGQTGPGGRPDQPQPVARGNDFGPGAQPHTGTPGTHGPGNRPGGTGPGNTGPGGRGPGGHSGPPHSPDGHGPDGHGPRQDPNGHPDGSPHDRGPDAEPDRPLTPDEVNQRHSEGTPAGSSYHRGDPDMGDLPHRVQPDPDGRYTVDVHVTPDGHARIGDRTYTPEEFADILRRNGDYDGRPIRLIGCDAGSNDFARRLSRELDTEVMAPSKPAWTDSNGRVFSSDYEIGPDGRTRPRIPPNGEWDVHSPDGTSRRASDDGFTPDTSHADKQDVDADSARDRGQGDDLNPQHQIEGRWDEPDFTPPARPVQLRDDQSFFDPTTPPRRLDPGTRYDVTDADGNVRSRVYTDANRNVTHVDAVAPNRLHGPGNPEIMRPAPNSDYRVQVGHRHDTFPTDADGNVRTVTHTDVKTTQGTRDVTRIGDIESPPKPRDQVRIEADDPRAPGANDAFSHRTDLDANTRYHVTDADGNSRGSFQTDEHGKVKWVDTHEGANNPELRDPLPDSNYRVDRGPLHQEYHVGPDGRPEHGQGYHPPQATGTPVDHPNAVKQDEAFNRQHTDENGNPRLDANDRPTLTPNSVHRPTDEFGHPRGEFQTDGTGHISHVDTTSGQRARTNPEVGAAPDGANITQDGHYGTRNAKNVQDSWPAPDREVTYSHQVPPKSENAVAHQNKDPRGFTDGDPSSMSDAQQKAISDKLAHKDPIAGRDDLPPNTRIHVVDKDGLPYGSFQTGPDGKITHMHTGQPFNADMNNPPPNAVVRVDHGLEMHDADGNPLGRQSPGEIHRTDARGNTVVTSAPPDPGGASNIRRDGSAQSQVGGMGGKDASGKNIDDGGHHRGTSVGGSGEALNQGSQGRVDNSNAGAKELKETYDADDSWYRMERDRDDSGLAGRLENEDTFELRDAGVDDAHTRQYRAYGPDTEGRISVIVRSFPNDHNNPLWPDDFRG